MKTAAILATAAFAVCAALVAPAAAQDVLSPARFALGVGVGTNGGVVEGSYKLTPQIVLRGQGAFIDFDAGFKSSDVHYSGKARFNTGGGFLDWHAFSNPWFVSAGAVGGDRKVDLHARGTSGTIKIDGQSYPLNEIGAVDGSADFGSPAPVVGLGWDNTFYTRGHWGFRALAGVAFGGKPEVNLHATGPFADNALVQAEVADEQASLQHDVRDYQYYPIVQVGLNYRF